MAAWRSGWANRRCFSTPFEEEPEEEPGARAAPRRRWRGALRRAGARPRRRASGAGAPSPRRRRVEHPRLRLRHRVGVGDLGQAAVGVAVAVDVLEDDELALAVAPDLGHLAVVDGDHRGALAGVDLDPPPGRVGGVELGGVARARDELLGGLLLDVVGVARLRVDREAALGEPGQGARQVARDARDQARAHQDRVDVPVGVVVGEDRLARVLRVAGGVEVAGGGEDRVDRVVGVLDAVLVGVDAVGAPGRGDELHPAERAGVGDVQVAAVVGLDLVDRRQHLPADAVLGAGRLVDRQQEDRDAELLDDEVRHRGRGRGAGEEAGAGARGGGLGQGRVRAGGGAVGLEVGNLPGAAAMTLASTSRVPLPGSVPAASAPARAAAAGAAVAAAAVRVDARDPTAATIGAAVRGGRRLVGRSRRRVRLLLGSLGRLGGISSASQSPCAEPRPSSTPGPPACSAASTSGPEPEIERTGAAASPRSSGRSPGARRPRSASHRRAGRCACRRPRTPPRR